MNQDIIDKLTKGVADLTDEISGCKLIEKNLHMPPHPTDPPSPAQKAGLLAALPIHAKLLRDALGEVAAAIDVYRDTSNQEVMSGTGQWLRDQQAIIKTSREALMKLADAG